jgi:hypothetical protein
MGTREARPPVLHERDAAFVVRIWFERREIEGAEPLWRGVVEHAQSGERRYLTELNSIVDFIAPYVRAMEERGDRQSRRLARLRQLWRRDSAADR